MPSWMALSFQDSNSPTTEQLMFFHDHSMTVLVLVTVLTMYFILSSITSKIYNKFLMEGQEIETIWTVSPSLMLIFIAMPSMKVLYLMEETKDPIMTIKVMGHQWYWSYEYAELPSMEFDSFMEPGTVRLLEVTQLTPLPINTLVRAIISSTDVVHSWALPAASVKVDAVPGRLNQTNFQLKRVGLFSGQCSEICGANHSFMPIMVKAMSMKNFIQSTKTN